MLLWWRHHLTKLHLLLIHLITESASPLTHHVESLLLILHDRLALVTARTPFVDGLNVPLQHLCSVDRVYMWHDSAQHGMQSRLTDLLLNRIIANV